MSTPTKITDSVFYDDTTVYAVVVDGKTLAHTEEEEAQSIIESMAEHEISNIEQDEWIKVIRKEENGKIEIYKQFVGRLYNSAPELVHSFECYPIGRLYIVSSEEEDVLVPDPEDLQHGSSSSE